MRVVVSASAPSSASSRSAVSSARATSSRLRCWRGVRRDAAAGDIRETVSHFLLACAAMLEREREQVATAARRLAADGLVQGTSGNVSARAGDHVAVTPTGGVLAELEAEHVTVVDLDGRVVDGELAPTSEAGLHLGVYRRYDAGAVVHTHAPMATALSTVLDELPCVHYEMLALGGTVRVAPYE